MIKNNRNNYGNIAKILHWGMAFIFIGMYIIGYVMTNISKSGFRLSLYDFHKATGLLMLALFAVRLSWRFVNVQPDLPRGMKFFLRFAAHGNVVALYLLMFIMPVSGFLTSTLGGHDISVYSLFIIAPLAHDASASHRFSTIHEIAGYVLIAVFVLHVLAALYHQYCAKDYLLKRMWF